MTATDRPTTRYAATAVQKAALIVGIVFLVVGAAGFIPGLTTNIEDLQFAGPESEAMLLGVFQVSILHNLVHLIFGIAGVGLAASFSGSKGYLIWGGAVYALLWIYGLLVETESPANFVPLNDGDDWLHLVLAVGMLLLGLLLGRRPDRARGRV